jgi:hypothetical protein
VSIQIDLKKVVFSFLKTPHTTPLAHLSNAAGQEENWGGRRAVRSGNNQMQFPLALGKRKTGVDDAPSAVEIVQELAHDMQVA